MRVLIIEDDNGVASTIDAALKATDDHCDIASTGEEGVDLAKLDVYDLIVLDLSLPDIDGHEVLRQIRGASIKTPVLILTGRGGIESKIKELQVGADDYLTKPFDIRELRARAHAVVRRAQGHSASTIRCGQLEIDLSARTATVDGKMLNLTAKEYAILELLCMRQGAVINKDMILDRVYGGLDEPSSQTIDVFMHTLRKKIGAVAEGAELIRTIRGRGYIISA